MNTPLIKLVTNDSRSVAEFQSPAASLMKPAPEGMTWGTRFFVFESEDEYGNRTYREGILWPLIEGGTCERVPF